MGDSKRAPWIGRFLLTMAVLCLAVGIMLAAYLWLQHRDLWRQARLRDQGAVALAERTVAAHLHRVSGDLAIQAGSWRARSLLEQPDAVTRSQIEQALRRLIEVRGDYARVQLLDAAGAVQVRIDRDAGGVRARAGAPADAAAVAAVRDVPAGRNVLQLRMNAAGPDLRLLHGIRDEAGRLLGVLTIDTDPGRLLQALQADAGMAEGQMWLVSGNHQWPLNGTRAPTAHPLAELAADPALERQLHSSERGSSLLDDGVFTFARVVDGRLLAANAPDIYVVSMVREVRGAGLGLRRYAWLYLLGLTLTALIAAWIVRQQAQLSGARRDTEANSRLMNDLFRHSPLMMKVKDLDGRIQRINESGARMIGRPAEELIGHGIGSVATPATVELIASHDREVIRGSRVSQYEERVDYIGGSYTLLTTRFPVTDAHGRVVGVGAVSTDITARSQFEESLKLAKAQAESANAAKSAFLSNMSHELRTPLNSIIGLSELLMEDLQDAGVPEHNESLRRVIQAGRHLLYLINDLLDMARVETGRLELCMEPTLVQEVVDAVEGTVRPLAAANGNQLTLDVEPGIRWVHADPNRLRQILLNLLGNAAKFTRHGRIHLRVGHAGKGREDQVAFVVSDDGIGMSAEQIERIFEPFRQADETIGRRFGGTGLGLTITRQLVELMGGDISVDSAPDQGSTFTVRLPAARPDAGVTTSTASVASLGGGRSTVLVVDDDADARSILAATLERDGLRVLTAATGAEALRLTQRELPDLLVLDIELPDMNGWELLAALRQDPRHALLPVILCTVTDRDQRAASLGVAEYFSKPLDRERLLTVVRRFLGASEGAVIGIVDDDEGYRRVMAETLSRAGYGVLEAASGPAILELLQSRRCDLLLLDVILPGMDGLEVLERLREQPRTLDLDVVLITAADLPPALVERIRDRALTLVRKQAETPEMLVRRVHETLLKTGPAEPKT